MKYLNMIGSLLLLSSTLTYAQGHCGVGGGDPCEDKFKENSLYLKASIEKGLVGHLKLNGTWTSDSYQSVMLTQINAVSLKGEGATTIECVSHKLSIGGVEKVCLGETSASGVSKITCNREAFLSLSERSQVRLTHHEWAQLNGIEINNLSSSDYSVSDQVIAVLSPSNSTKVELIDYPNPFCTYEYSHNYAYGEVKHPISPLLKAALDKLGCIEETARQSKTNHLLISSEGGAGSYEGNAVALLTAVKGKTHVINATTQKELATHSEIASALNVSIHLLHPRSIMLSRYDNASDRAMNLSESEMATLVQSLIQ